MARPAPLWASRGGPGCEASRAWRVSQASCGQRLVASMLRMRARILAKVGAGRPAHVLASKRRADGVVCSGKGHRAHCLGEWQGGGRRSDRVLRPGLWRGPMILTTRGWPFEASLAAWRERCRRSAPRGESGRSSPGKGGPPPPEYHCSAGLPGSGRRSGRADRLAVVPLSGAALRVVPAGWAGKRTSSCSSPQSSCFSHTPFCTAHADFFGGQRPHLPKRLARGGGAAASARSSLSGGALPSQLDSLSLERSTCNVPSGGLRSTTF